MEVSSLASSQLGNSVGVSAMKKAINVQEKQMQDLLQGASENMQTMNAKNNTKTTNVAQELGVGVNLNTMA
jgi:hypothetical protein